MKAAAHPTILRMIDANANRAREALRMLEDYTRFSLNDPALSADLKRLRHALAATLASPALRDAILFRDTGHDVGMTIKTDAEFQRDSLASLVIAAGKRLSESLRVLEECLKTIDPALAHSIEQLRYRGYILEQTLTRIAGGSDARARFAKVRLYILLTDALCHPSLGGWEKTLDLLLAAPSAGDSTTLCIQLREKSLEGAELLRRAKILTAKCRAANSLSIINDRPDIAILADADGIHLGQTDLPCADARQLLGSDKVIGISTENLAQGRQAMRDGATYLALGPMFPTTTKDKSHLPVFPGPAYAAQAHQEFPSDVPLVPIGGITLENLPQLKAARATRICTCSAIISTPDPVAAVRAFLQQLR
jgi:thiamine-phosphate pyrophosphorylase